MGKALVLRGTDFSVNRLDVVTYLDPIPCTGLSISAHSIGFTSMSTATLSATFTPVDTTDILEWRSSNENVATVTNGIVTAVGLGSAVITAVCGTFSETCAVSVNISLTAGDIPESCVCVYPSRSVSELANGKDTLAAYIYVDSSSPAVYSKHITVCSTTPTPYKAITNTDSRFDNLYPIKIPRGTVTIETTTSDLYSFALFFMDSTTKATYLNAAANGTKVVATGGSTVYASGTPKKTVYTMPDNIGTADSCVIDLGFSNALESVPSDLVINFKGAS